MAAIRPRQTPESHGKRFHRPSRSRALISNYFESLVGCADSKYTQ